LQEGLALSPYSHSSPAIEQVEPSRGMVLGQAVAPASGPPELLPLLPDEPPDEPLPPELVLLVLPPLLLLPEDAPEDDPLALPDEPVDDAPDEVLLPPELLPELPPEPEPLEPCPAESRPAPPSPRLSVKVDPPQAHIAVRATTAKTLERMIDLPCVEPLDPSRSNSDTTWKSRGVLRIRASHPMGARDMQVRGLRGPATCEALGSQ
jgi:hypothetical protein